MIHLGSRHTLISQGIVATLRSELFSSLLDQPVFFTGHKAGDLLSRINMDIDGVEDVITDTVFGLISNALVTAATVTLMFVLSWPLTLAVLVMIPLVGLPTRRAGQAMYAARGRTQRQRGAMSAYLQEILGPAGDPRHLRHHAGQGLRQSPRRTAAIRADEPRAARPRSSAEPYRAMVPEC